jgi:OOP family OmpA-OmpF porin
MRQKKYFWILSFLAMFLLAFTAQQAGAASHESSLDAKVASGQWIQKTDVFEVIFDATLSMNDIYKNNTKLNQSKALVVLFNDTIPRLKLTAFARAFGQFVAFGDDTSKLLFGPVTYSKPVLPQSVAPFATGMGFSPIDAAFDGATADLKGQTGRMAVVVFSDGEDMEKYEPVAAARRMKGAYGDRICIYTVHIGDNAAGRKLMQQLADAGQCGVMVTGDSISSPAGMADFVTRVFLEGKKAAPAKVPPRVVEQEIKAVKEAASVVKPAPAPKPEPVSIALNVEFDTNKANIKPKYDAEIKKVADFMIQYPKTTAVIEGHTDNVGKEAANVKLSQRRADSIKAYLVKKFGIDASRLKAVGFGPNRPIASNDTKEGKQKNRRVTAVFSQEAK